MRNNKTITPLNQWPTEAILMLFRKNRRCYSEMPRFFEVHYNRYARKDFYYEPIKGTYIDDEGVVYNNVTIGHHMLTKQEYDQKFKTYVKEHTVTLGNHGYINEYDYYCPINKMSFVFEGMYWEGTVDEVKAELAKRPHVNIKGAKEFRKWKLAYKKSK